MTSVTAVAPKFSDALTLFQPGRADSAQHRRGCSKNFPAVTSLKYIIWNSLLQFLIKNLPICTLIKVLNETNTTKISYIYHIALCSGRLEPCWKGCHIGRCGPKIQIFTVPEALYNSHPFFKKSGKPSIQIFLKGTLKGQNDHAHVH